MTSPHLLLAARVNRRAVFRRNFIRGKFNLPVMFLYSLKSMKTLRFVQRICRVRIGFRHADAGLTVPLCESLSSRRSRVVLLCASLSGGCGLSADWLVVAENVVCGDMDSSVLFTKACNCYYFSY